MRRIITILVTALGLSTQAIAATPHLYEVQVLVFANHLHKLDGHEQWSQEKITPIAGFKRALAPSDSLPLGSQLAIAQSTLSRHPHYSIIGAYSWVQNAVSLRTTKAIRIESQTGGGKLKGVIRVFQWRLMHVALDLHYTPTAGVLGSDTPQVYQLRESRPIALRRTNYFDHPKFGVLVRIVPYTGPVGSQR
ncbi:MAG: CsiV family protein [Acidiferrobacter sp.]